MIKDLVEQIPETDFDIASDDSQGQVEIIGWLYQYYNQEPHHEVVDINGGPVKEHDIPAATQLFTTDWIVRYMVDNSLGRYYLDHAPESKLANQLKYLLPGELHPVDSTVNLSSLHVLDNAMGSGHILVYAFDVLMKIYEEQGYSQREAAQQIATENLFGLEIDKRAYQLAYFAIMMKVRQYDRRALRRELKLNLYVFEDSKNLNDEFLAHLPISEDDRSQIAEIRDVFLNAKTLGSIMHFDHQFYIQELLDRLDSETQDISDNLFVDESNLAQLRQMLKVVEVMQSHYEVIVTNPPYLNKMNKTLKDYVKKYYKAYSGDLFSVFIWLNINMTVKNGYAAYMTPFVWMFIKTYEALRINILNTMSISSLIQMEYSAFEEATVPINTFVLKNSREPMGTYIKLSDFKGGMDVQRDKVLEALDTDDCKYVYRANQANFEKIPGSPIAYWVPRSVVNSFSNTALSDYGFAGIGMRTGDNKRFLRHWFEVGAQNSKLNGATRSDTQSKTKWIPYNKGGNYRKWYGNNDYVVNWKNDGAEIKENTRRVYPELGDDLGWKISNEKYYFLPGVTWTGVSSGTFSARAYSTGFIFDSGANGLFADNEKDLYQLLGLLNSKVGDYLIKLLNPTINTGAGTIRKLPIFPEIMQSDYRNLILPAIQLVKTDWNTEETSWNYQQESIVDHIAEHTLALLRKLADIQAHVPKMCQRIIIPFKGVNQLSW